MDQIDRGHETRNPVSPLRRADGRRQLEPRAHHDIHAGDPHLDVRHSDQAKRELYLREALNWNQRDLSQSENFRGRGPKGYSRGDRRILEEACELLQDDPYVDASEISVRCEQGIVTLEGTVDTRATKRRAESLVERCGGVRDVQNWLTLAS